MHLRCSSFAPGTCLLWPVLAQALMQCDDAPGCTAHPGGLFPDFDCRGSEGQTWAGPIDWDSWRRLFEKEPASKWADGPGTKFLNLYMDGDGEAHRRYWEECPLGVLNADMLLYSVSVHRFDSDIGATFAERVRQELPRFPIRILLGSKWPLLSIFTSKSLRRARPDIAEDERLNCADIETPALNWVKFQSQFYGEDKKDWYENTMRYVLSWQIRQIPTLLAEECPLGVLTAYAIQIFTCATSESSCFRGYAQRLEAWLARGEALEILAHSRWPIAVVLNHMAGSTRHRYRLDFSERELVASPEVLARLPWQGLSAPALQAASALAEELEATFPQGLPSLGPWASTALPEQGGFSRSFRDLLGALPHLGPAPPGGPRLVYISMVYGASFNRHIRRFCARARALGPVGGRLLLFALDDEAHRLCLLENGQRCVRGSPSIMNKFTLPLMCAHLGLDSVWLDLDIFLMQDPSPALLEHAQRGPYDILISGSFESDCICNGIVYFRSTEAVRAWLLAVVIWMYHHPYEHDQKTFSAFLNYTETVQQTSFALPQIPAWDTLDPINAFVTPDTFEGNGWMGELEHIVIFHFLNGESDTGSGLDPSGTWTREHGRFGEDGGAPPPCQERDCAARQRKISLMDLFYDQADEELYTTPKPAQDLPALRRALLASRKTSRRLDLLGKPCGPMVGVLGAPVSGVSAEPGLDGQKRSASELLALARLGGRPPT